MPAGNVSHASCDVQPLASTTVTEAKGDPVLRRYSLRRLRLPIGGETLSLVVPDAGSWIRRGAWVAATERGAEPPYWVQVWPASVCVARLLARVGSLRGKRVLDLGCGLGVPGIAAAKAGATVTFADREPDALAFAVWNGTRAATDAAPVAHRLDWSREVVPGAFDVVLLADVSYRPVHHAALRRHLDACLAPGGVIVHAEPQRRESRAFVQWLQDAFATEVVLASTSFRDARIAVRVCVAIRQDDPVGPWRQALTAIGDSGQSHR